MTNIMEIISKDDIENYNENETTADRVGETDPDINLENPMPPHYDDQTDKIIGRAQHPAQIDCCSGHGN